MIYFCAHVSNDQLIHIYIYVRVGRYPRMQLQPAGALTFMAFGNWMLLLCYRLYDTQQWVYENDLFQKDRPSCIIIIYFLFRIRTWHRYRVGIVVNSQLWLNTVCFYVLIVLIVCPGFGSAVYKWSRERFITEMRYFCRVIHHNVYRPIDLYTYIMYSICFRIET